MKAMVLLGAAAGIVGVFIGYAKDGGPLWLAQLLAAGLALMALRIGRWVWTQELDSRRRVRRILEDRKRR
jgi:hypothetical protein